MCEWVCLCKLTLECGVCVRKLMLVVCVCVYLRERHPVLLLIYLAAPFFI